MAQDVKSIEISEDVKTQIRRRIVQIEEDIVDKISEDYVGEIVESLKKLGGDDKNLNRTGRNKIWEISKQNFPKSKFFRFKLWLEALIPRSVCLSVLQKIQKKIKNFTNAYKSINMNDWKRINLILDDLKTEDKLKTEDNLKSEDNLRTDDNLKN